MFEIAIPNEMKAAAFPIVIMFASVFWNRTNFFYPFCGDLNYQISVWIKKKHSRPKKGSALLFFPAAGGIPNAPFDVRTLHCGEAVASDAANDKWIAQLWLRERSYAPTAPPENENGKDGPASLAVGEYTKDYLSSQS